MDAGIGYPLYDLTSSGLNQASKRSQPLEPNRHRLATMNRGDNFGLITIDWNRDDPLLRLQIRDDEGEVTIQQKVPLSLLQPGALPTP
jgi:alkaline phosphatase D